MAIKSGHHNFLTCPTKQSKTQPYLPSMIVFDLDDCLWSPEMFVLPDIPSIPIKGDLNPKQQEKDAERTKKKDTRSREVGIVGMKVDRPNGETVRLFGSAREVLRDIALNQK